ncbi:MAG: hypothetical protein AAF961_16675, partial [Planctomycetota bacterium]
MKDRLLAFALLAATSLGTPTSMLFAAEFRGINRDTLNGHPYYILENSIVSVTTISGDGRKLGGHASVRAVNFECGTIECGIAPYTLLLGEKRRLDSLAPFTGFDIDRASYFDAVNYAAALSHDGSTALLNAAASDASQTYVFDGKGTTQLDVRPLGLTVRGVGVSASGNSIVGNSGSTPFLWRPFGGAREISGLADEFDWTVVGISGDGHSVLVNARPGVTHGRDWTNRDERRGNAVVWTDDGTLTELMPIEGHAHSAAVAASHDGAILVGNSMIKSTERPNLGRAVRWANGTIEALGTLNRFEFSNARDVAADGKLVVEQAYNLKDPTLSPDVEIPLTTTVLAYPFGFAFEVADPSRAVLWEADGKALDLQELLVDQYRLGQELTG